MTLSIVRNGKASTVTITPLEQKEDGDAAAAGREAPASSNDLGAELSALDDDLRRRYGVPKDVSGVVVTSVSGRGRAAGKLVKGDVIVEVNFVPVSSVSDTLAKVKSALATPKQPLLIRAKRRGDAGWFDQFVSIELAK